MARCGLAAVLRIVFHERQWRRCLDRLARHGGTPLQRLQQASVAKMVGKASTIGEDGVLRVRASAFACQLVHLDYITITGPILSISGPSSPSPAPPLHHRPMLSITGPFSPSPTPSLHHQPLRAPPPVSGPRPAPYPIPLFSALERG